MWVIEEIDNFYDIKGLVSIRNICGSKYVWNEYYGIAVEVE